MSDFRSPAATLAAVLLLEGCSLWGDSGPSVRSVTYQCPDNVAFTVTYSGDRLARLQAGEDTNDLKRVPAASGMRYSDGDLSLFVKGNFALVEERGRIRWRDCRAK